MFNQILVPLDGSALATSVLPHAVALAQALGSNLTLLRVLEEQAETNANRTDWQLHKAEARAALTTLGARIDEQMDRPPHLQLLTGSAAQSIIDYAQTGEFDLVALSSQLYNVPNGWNISSVVQKVVDRLRKSILLVRTDQATPACAKGNWAAFRYRRILVPLDGSQRAEAVLPLVTALAHYYEAELLIVHVLDQPALHQRMPQVAKDTAAWMERNRTQANQSFAALQARLPLISHLNMQVSSNIAATLHTLVDQADADLVILSAQGKANQQQWSYGSIAASFIGHGTTPLLIMQDLLLPKSKAECLAMNVSLPQLIHRNLVAALSS